MNIVVRFFCHLFNVFPILMFLLQALAKKARAEKLLEELDKEEIPQQLEIDKEGITEEERYMLRKVGLRMKPFLLLGEHSSLWAYKKHSILNLS